MRRNDTSEKQPLLVNEDRTSSDGVPMKQQDYVNDETVYRVVRSSFTPTKNFKAINFPRITFSQIGRDIYYHLIKMNWWTFFLCTTAVYLFVSTIFFVIYATVAFDGFEPKPSDLDDIFFFSFGRLTGMDGRFETPGLVTEIVAIIEAFCCVILGAMLTGIMYFRFSRPNARILFTNQILISKFNGQLAVLFRTANSRTTHIMEAQARLWAVITERTKEGGLMHRLYNLELQRDVSPTFSVFPWTVFHIIDEKSPLYGISPQKLVEWDCTFNTMVSGVDSMFGDAVHAHRRWGVEDVRFGGQWEDIIRDEGSTRIFDYQHFYNLKQMKEKVLYL